MARWLAREDAVLTADDNYRLRGGTWCLERLPGRTLTAIHQRAYRLGLTTCTTARRIETTPAVDAIITTAYRGTRPPGFVERAARQVGRPEWWVSRRASELGLVPALGRLPWDEKELDYAAGRPLLSATKLCCLMREHGWHRRPAEITQMRRQGRLPSADEDLISVEDLADLFGVSNKTVLAWIHDGALVARRRGAGSGLTGKGFLIHERDIAAFVVGFPTRVSLTKLEPNKVWFLALLAQYAREPSRQDGQMRARILSLSAARPDLTPAQVADKVGCKVALVLKVRADARAGRGQDPAGTGADMAA